VGKREHRPPATSSRHGKRGRHKHRGSTETRRWEADHLPPDRPAWMPRQVYLDLIRLRGSL
jgi:hypothetical protein